MLRGETALGRLRGRAPETWLQLAVGCDGPKPTVSLPRASTKRGITVAFAISDLLHETMSVAVGLQDRSYQHVRHFRCVASIISFIAANYEGNLKQTQQLAVSRSMISNCGQPGTSLFQFSIEDHKIGFTSH